MSIIFNNVQITGGLTFIPEIFVPNGDPYWANVSLLMNNTTTNNQTNNTFLDSSTNNFTVTRVGTVTQGSFTPFTVAPNTSYSTSTNGGSGYFLGASNYLSLASSSAFDLGSGDFTIEFWIKTSANGSILARDTNENVNYGNLSVQVIAGKLRFYCNPNSGNATGRVTLESTTTVTNNAWYHIAITRNSNSWALYVNGTSEATATSSVAFRDATALLYVGCVLVSNAPGNFYTGYISSLRIVKGTAVYTGNFTTPTSPLSAISGTSLLLNFTNAGIYDAKAVSDLTTLSDTKVSNAQAKFGNASVYFDGAGDYLITSTTTGFNIGQNDFTVECWVRPLNVSGIKGVLGNHPSLTGGGYGIYLNNNIPTGTILVTGQATASYATGPAIGANTWSHLAFVKSSGNTKMYVNGVGGNAVSSSYNSDNSSAFYIGAFEGTVYLFGGYIQDVRLTLGVARYTANFTPPTEPFITY